MDGKLQRHLDFTPAEQTDAVLGAPQHPAPDQGLDVDSIFGVEGAAIDRGLNAVEVHLVEFKREDVIEAALRQPPMQRHLAALEALDAHAGTRGLALAAATAGLAHAGADAAADAGALLARAGTIGELVQLHRWSPFASTTRTRCLTLASMPRVCGVSVSSVTRPIPFSPSPINVSRWE